jgi:hypothetical protein
VVATFGVVDREPWWIVFGVVAGVLGAWFAMKALSIGPSWRGLAWVVTQCAILGAVLAAVVLLGLDGVAMWLSAGVAVFAAPWIATRLTGVREAE